MNRRHFSTALAGSAIGSAGLLQMPLAWGEDSPPVEGRDFAKVEPPQPIGTPGKIEVLEFFSYACPHCHAFEPALESWAHQQPGDVVLRRVPVPFLMNSDNFEHAYYALETVGLVNTMQMKVFNAIHVEHQRLETGEDIAAFVGKNGGDAAKFLAAFKSFSVATSVARAKKMTADYKIDSVPSLVVQGRYLTSPSMAGNAGKGLVVAEQLIQRVRKG